MRRPVIGITSYVEPAQWGVWQAPAVLVPYAYVQSVEEAGGRAVVLPPDGHDGDVMDRLDGLIIAGGADVEPARYGQSPHPLTYTRPDRDAGEFALLAAALARRAPVLAICRGMQVLTVAYDGVLHQHLPDVVGHDKHQPEPGVVGWHGVRFTPDSLIARIADGTVAEVNSYHHQGIADPGRLTVTGWSDDGVIEVVEDPSMPFVLGVQWHPEELADSRLFRALAAACHPDRPAGQREGAPGTG